MLYPATFTNPTALIIFAVIALVLFGGAKIPEMMRGLGSGMREFKNGMKEPAAEDDELRREREREAEIRRRVEEEMRKNGK